MSDGTLGDDPCPIVTLEELRRSVRPMSVLQRVERAAMTLELGSKGHIAAAKLFLSKTQPDLKALEVAMTGVLENLDDASLTAAIDVIRRLVAAEQADGGAGAARKSQATH